MKRNNNDFRSTLNECTIKNERLTLLTRDAAFM